MRNLVLLFSALILSTSGVMAYSTNEDKVAPRNAYRYNDSFIFMENGITFSVYPDGEFDFYIDNYVEGRRNGITFNSGYDYSPYAQYDDYGAVIQVENVPIFYDYYGRVTQIGDVDLAYRNGRVFRMGGMYVYYNDRGFYDYHSGYINTYNRYYVYSPFHAFFARPLIGFSLVFNQPYRRYYSPVRYTYYHPYVHNQRRAYAAIGKEYRYNKVRPERATIYRNDKRVSVRDNSTRTNRSVASRSDVGRTNRNDAKRGENQSAGRTAMRSNTPRANERNLSGRSVDQGERTVRSSSVRKAPATSNRSDVTRKASRSQNDRTVGSSQGSPSRSANGVSTRSKAQRSVSEAPTRSSSSSRNSVSSRSTAQRSVSNAPARSRTTTARSTSSRSTASKAPSRSAKNNTRSVATRSNGRQ
ncbi:MAG: hypothetical protein MUO53_15345 [Maribacter sp.]|nr:hypothetical protein [Maribacter sp.]